jgi:glycosyltransferase involved in cell wall biosynthesis
MTAPIKKRLAFIDHSFHKATRSSAFFQEILSRDYEVTLFFDEAWKQGPEVDLHAVNRGNFDVVLFWQVLPSPSRILRFSCRDLIWVPMYDNEWYRSSKGWRLLRLLGLKVVCFSRALYEIAQGAGVHSFPLQYFPEPSPAQVAYGRPRVFFWHRIQELDWPLVRQLLARSDIEKIVVKDDPDPNHAFSEPDPADVAQFGIEVVRNLKVSGGASFNDYMRMLTGCNVFIAPRLREGIGLSFLEAMALGMCVIAPDASTMNEYISPGANGFLFDPERPAPIDLSTFAECGKRAREFTIAGRQQWEESLPAMLQFIAQPIPKQRSSWDAIRFLLWTAASRTKLAVDRKFSR